MKNTLFLLLLCFRIKGNENEGLGSIIKMFLPFKCKNLFLFFKIFTSCSLHVFTPESNIIMGRRHGAICNCIPDSALRDYSYWSLRKCKRCQGLDPGQSHVGKFPYSLHNFPGLPILLFITLFLFYIYVTKVLL